jgi:quercetin dioxygenase-like cupin family protein
MAATPTEVFRFGQLEIRFLIDGTVAGIGDAGSVSMFEFDVAPGAKVPVAHSHDAYEETLYGLEGVLTLTVDGQRVELGSGDVLLIRRGAVHRFDNFGAVPTRTLAVITPGILGAAYFRDVAEAVKASAGGPPDPKAIGEVMRRHGLTPVTQG